MKRIFAYIIAAAALCSCTDHYLPEQIQVIELGATAKVITLFDTVAGDGNFEIYANCDWDYRQLTGGEWLGVDSVSPIEGRQNRYKMHFKYFANNGYRRSANLVIFKDNRYDTLQVRQEGTVLDSINVHAFTGGVIPAKGGSYSVVVETTVPERNLSVASSKSSQFSQLYYSGHRLYFTINAAAERDKKDYVLTVYTVDGWGETVQSSITVSQAPRED